MSLSDSLVDLGFGVGWSAVKRMPEPAVNRVFDALAERAYRRDGRGVRQLRANLARVVPDARSAGLDAATREGMRRYLRYWSEAFRLPAWSAEQVRERFTLEHGLDQLDAAVDAGAGAIMVTSHSGNWDLAGAWACDRYGSLVTVAERLKPEGLYDKFVAYRESLGMEVLPHGDAESFRTLVRRLREGKLVCLVADRDLSGSGVPVDFFGETASMPGGPALLSTITGAPIMNVGLWHVDEGLRARVGDPLVHPEGLDRAETVAALTQSMADGFAASIRAHPVDWHMMQPLFHADVPRRDPS
ncbi:MAG: phosphatidylinositol mannoside acyltransferase [Candidatus Nanopelagicales bacterium]